MEDCRSGRAVEVEGLGVFAQFNISSPNRQLPDLVSDFSGEVLEVNKCCTVPRCGSFIVSRSI
jgi:hypothetical protein